MTETENKSFIGKLGDTISEKWASLGDNQAIFVIFAVVLVLVLIMAIVSVRSSRKSAINAITDELDELSSDIREAETLENAQKIIYTLLYALFASTLVSYLSHRSINKMEADSDKLKDLSKTIDNNQADLIAFLKTTTGFNLSADDKQTIYHATLGKDTYNDSKNMTGGASPVLSAEDVPKVLLPAMAKYAEQKVGLPHIDLTDKLAKLELQRLALIVVYEALVEGQDKVVAELFNTGQSLTTRSKMTTDQIETSVDKLKEAFLNDVNFNKINLTALSTPASDKAFLKLNFKDAVDKLTSEIAYRNILTALVNYPPKDDKYVTITRWNGIFVNPLNGDGLTQNVGLFLQDVIGIVCFPFSVLDYIDHTLVNVDTWYIDSKETMGVIQHPEEKVAKPSADKEKSKSKDANKGK